VRPVLRAAGLEVVAQETQHAGHASQMTADLDLQRTSALVMVGGDGTVFEALQACACT
jgi:diacylglycerol kinase family enzyme